MKDLLLYVRVIKTLNLKISRCHLADYIKELYWFKVCAIHAAQLFFLIEPIRSSFSGVVAIALVLA